jgi:hypothetical protein
MFGYVLWHEHEKGAPRLYRDSICGAIFAVLEVRGCEGFRLRRRLNRAARKMSSWGVRQTVFPPDFPLTEPFAAQGIGPLPEQTLRCALLEKLLSRLCIENSIPLSQSAAALLARRTDEKVWRAGEVLAQRSRFLILSTGTGGAALGDHLRYTYGVSAAPVAPVAPILGVYYTDLPDTPPFEHCLCLGPHCEQEQRVTCEVSAEWQEKLGEKKATTQLLAALFSMGRIQIEEIKVKSVSRKLDRTGENLYNAT